MYKLSKATYLRIKSNNRSKIKQNERINQDQACLIISGDAKKLIKEYLKHPQRLIRIKDLRESIFETTGKDIDYNFIREFAKAELLYNFKERSIKMTKLN